MAREIDEITGIIVDAAYKIHTGLGPGLLESVYEAVLAREWTDEVSALNDRSASRSSSMECASMRDFASICWSSASSSWN